jgi:hypothetical protein
MLEFAGLFVKDPSENAWGPKHSDECEVCPGEDL